MLFLLLLSVHHTHNFPFVCASKIRTLGRTFGVQKTDLATQHHELPEWSPTPVLNGPIKLNFAIRNGMRCGLDGMAVSPAAQHSSVFIVRAVSVSVFPSNLSPPSVIHITLSRT